MGVSCIHLLHLLLSTVGGPHGRNHLMISFPSSQIRNSKGKSQNKIFWLNQNTMWEIKIRLMRIRVIKCISIYLNIRKHIRSRMRNWEFVTHMNSWNLLIFDNKTEECLIRRHSCSIHDIKLCQCQWNMKGVNTKRLDTGLGENSSVKYYF